MTGFRTAPSAHVDGPVDDVIDIDEANTNNLDPLVPRPIDLPTELPLDGVLDPAIGDIAKIFAAPADPRDWPAWRTALAAWRDEARSRLDYRGTIYDRPETAWTSACYSVALVWLWDERLFDRAAGRFDVDAFLARTADHGGFDGIVLWHAYPVIGIDDRNQFDFYRDVPGITELVAEFRGRGIRVFIDYNPWDTGTRRAANDDAEELALIVAELGVDGVFLDTMKEGDSRLVQALLDAEPPRVLEGESRVPNQRIQDHQLSWAQWFADSEAPGVMRAHWFERRHMMHSTRRWNRDHGDELQSAFLNGTGMLVWDTVFGVWVGWNERDRATLRRMLRVQRTFTRLFSHGEWTPLADATPEAVTAGVYASRFEGVGADEGLVVWTIANRGDSDHRGEVIAPFRDAGVEAGAGGAGASTGGPGASAGAWTFVDLGSGRVLGSEPGAVEVPARSVTAILAVAGSRMPSGAHDAPAVGSAAVSESRSEAVPGLAALLEAAASDTVPSDSAFPARTAERVPFAPTGPAAESAPASLRSTPRIRLEAGERTMPFRYRRRETGSYQGAPYVEEWKPLAPRLHDPREESLRVTLGAVEVAASEVTLAEFVAFVEATGYEPACDNRFLVGAADPVHPVTGVDLDDARAYARWAGARLPTEFEWQAAAGRPGFRRALPLVWNWTESEHTDGITRFTMLKGGSDHVSLGSEWYTDGGPREPEFALKFVLPGLGLDRSPSIGFRLAWDAAESREERN